MTTMNTVTISSSDPNVLLHALAFQEAHLMVERQLADPQSPLADMPSNRSGDILVQLLTEANNFPGVDLILTTLFQQRSLQEQHGLHQVTLRAALIGWRMTIMNGPYDGYKIFGDQKLVNHLVEMLRYLEPDSADRIIGEL